MTYCSPIKSLASSETMPTAVNVATNLETDINGFPKTDVMACNTPEGLEGNTQAGDVHGSTTCVDEADPSSLDAVAFVANG